MEIEISSKKDNPLLDRIDVYFSINHKDEGTPARELVRENLAKALNMKKENIVIDHMRSVFGVQRSKGYAKAYSSVNKAKEIERRYVLERNLLVEKASKKKEKTPEKPVAAEKPKEKEPSKAPKEEQPAEAEGEKEEPATEPQMKEEVTPTEENAGEEPSKSEGKPQTEKAQKEPVTSSEEEKTAKSEEKKEEGKE
ncbi:ribosomal protein S24E [Thermoplasmatales archaeon SCGC AB-539-N05]|nr:ribosomal protein S24E [Thermoplasmatales archaeon SCGC AB-539-N05]